MTKTKVPRHHKKRDLKKKMLNPVSFPDIGKDLQLKNSRIRFTKKPTQESKDSEKPSTEVRQELNIKDKKNSFIKIKRKQFVSFLNRPCISYKMYLELYQISMMEFFKKLLFCKKKKKILIFNRVLITLFNLFNTWSETSIICM